ncbi:hypothetical protein AVEN_153512-1 [Araneus ventricosus]|uniref:Uncharacterized protein n=1 Tax=Araneus ventricosus TaxID=182803 RepID=A0A4Y2XB66_ARAVE|nr:hypothetical protein AVEN_153512-1 [Araneus ventricosus]
MSACCTSNQSSCIKHTFAVVVQKCGEGLKPQVSSSSSVRSSKLLGQSQINPHVASKRDDNITKLSRTDIDNPKPSSTIKSPATRNLSLQENQLGGRLLSRLCAVSSQSIVKQILPNVLYHCKMSLQLLPPLKTCMS